jgi:hypothetical protein
VALAKGKSIAAAARIAGISRRTAYRRLKDPLLERLVKELRAQIRSNMIGLMTGGMKAAVKTMRRLLNEDSPLHIQLGGAERLLKHGYVNAIDHPDPLYNDLDCGRLAKIADTHAQIEAKRTAAAD